MTDQQIDNTPKQNEPSSFSLVQQDNGIAHLIIDVVGESMNTLKAEFIDMYL